MQPRNLALGRTMQIVLRSAKAATGWVEVNSAFVESFETRGLESPEAFLDLSGEVVSGHPDRHVVRVTLPGMACAFYLKRQHRVTWREKLRNWDAGFGWVSRSEREAAILKQLAATGLACPRWAAFGVDGRGRAFLLIEELPGAVDLRQFLSGSGMSLHERRRFAGRLGEWIALYHDSGFTTPELSAKHVQVSQRVKITTLIDWQSSLREPIVSGKDRLRSLAALHASLAEPLARPRERLRVLWSATRSAREHGQLPDRFSDIVRQVLAESRRLSGRRSIRDQRQNFLGVNQKLVWLAGEAVCAIPEIAANWPVPAVVAPYYGCQPGSMPVELPDGRAAHLVRGKSFAPLGRFRAWLRGRSWRSPGVTLGRVLFHLERYGLRAPRLLAFGQRFTSPWSAEWFALHTPPAAVLSRHRDPFLVEELGRQLRRLHDAGCSAGHKPLLVFGLDDGEVVIRDPRAIRIARPDAEHELRRLLAALTPSVRKLAEAGYRQEASRLPSASAAHTHLTPFEVAR